jgi:hypothetical protein
MQIVKNYDVVFGAGAKEFNKAVNDAIVNGWQPFGGVQPVWLPFLKLAIQQRCQCFIAKQWLRFNHHKLFSSQLPKNLFGGWLFCLLLKCLCYHSAVNQAYALPSFT